MFAGQAEHVIAFDVSQRSHHGSALEFPGLTVARAVVSDSGMHWQNQLQDWLVRSIVKPSIDR